MGSLLERRNLETAEADVTSEHGPDGCRYLALFPGPFPYYVSVRQERGAGWLLELDMLAA